MICGKRIFFKSLKIRSAPEDCDSNFYLNSKFYFVRSSRDELLISLQQWKRAKLNSTHDHKALGFLYAFEESAEWALLSSF